MIHNLGEMQRVTSAYPDDLGLDIVGPDRIHYHIATIRQGTDAIQVQLIERKEGRLKSIAWGILIFLGYLIISMSIAAPLLT